MAQKLRSFSCDDALWAAILKKGGSPWLREVAQREITAEQGETGRKKARPAPPSEDTRRAKAWLFWNIYTREPKTQKGAAKNSNYRSQAVASTFYEVYVGWHRVCGFEFAPHTRQEFYVLLSEFGAVFSYYGVQKRIANRELIGKPIEPLPEDGL